MAMIAGKDRQKRGRAKAFYIWKMKKDRIDDMEDYYLAVKQLARKTGSRGFAPLTSEKVRRELGLKD